MKLTKLKEWLAREGRTQVWLANKTGIERMYLSTLIGGRQPITLKNALQINDVTGVKLRHLLTKSRQDEIKKAFDVM